MPERKQKTSKAAREAAEAEKAEAEAVEPPEGVEAEAFVPPEGVEAEAVVPPEAEGEVDPVARLEAEVASLKDQLLRALAETENLRRRSRREREDAVKYAAAPLIKDLIGVADNLRRALESVAPEAVEGDEPLKTLLAGLELTEKELNSVFEKHHIVKIQPLGERLDPHYHEAMFEIPNPETASGTVLQVIQAGYRLHDRLLRPAQVGVAKGKPGPAPDVAKEPPTQDAETGEAGPAAEPEGGSGSADEPEAGPGSTNGKGNAPGSRIDTTA